MASGGEIGLTVTRMTTGRVVTLCLDPAAAKQRRVHSRP